MHRTCTELVRSTWSCSHSTVRQILETPRYEPGAAGWEALTLPLRLASSLLPHLRHPSKGFGFESWHFFTLLNRASYARHDSPSWTFSRAFGKLVANELMSFTFCCCSSSSESLSPFRSASKLIQVELFPNLYIFDQTASGFLNVCLVS